MGYTIIYQRAFIRTNRGIIATVLGGCNNVTTPYWDAKGRPRERRERSWHPLYRNRATVEMPEADLLKWIEAHPTEPEHELFKFHSSWIRGDQEKAWFQAGIKSACTVEDYLRCNPGQSLRCELTINTVEPDWRPNSELLTFCKTTDQLESWIDAANARIAEVEAQHPGAYAYVGIGFEGCRMVKVLTKVSGPVVAKEGSRYLTGYEKGRSYEFSADADRAIIFPSVEAAMDELASFILKKVKFVKAASLEKAEPEKNWVLYFDSGSRVGTYVQKVTRGRLHYCYQPEYAKHFAKRSDAIRCANSVLSRFKVSSTIQIKNLQSGHAEAYPATTLQEGA